MNTLREAVQEYLTLRRSLGFKLREDGARLADFAAYMEQHKASYITHRLALAWAQEPKALPSEWARRLGFVRVFARYRNATDPRTQIPPTGLLPYPSTRIRPYIYSDREIWSLLDAALEMPAHSAQIQRVLAIPSKRFTRAIVHFMSRPEVDTLLAAPDRQTWLGRRDHAFILMAAQTGLRLSEMTGLQRKDILLGTGAHVRVIGKGRKERCTPLAKPTVSVLKAWLREQQRGSQQTLFPNARHASSGLGCLTAREVSARVGPVVPGVPPPKVSAAGVSFSP